MTESVSADARHCGVVDNLRLYGSLVIGLALAVHTIYAAFEGLFDITYTRGLIVWASVVACLLAEPLSRSLVDRSTGAKVLCDLVDLLLIAAMTVSIWYFLSAAENLNTMLVSYDTTDVAIAFVGVFVVLETTRRMFGLPLFLFILVVLAYGLLGDNIPRSWGGHSGFSLSATTEMVWYGFQGVFGTPLSIVIQVVLIYIIFGVILETTGASSSLIRVAFALTGRTRGGVGHAAIVSSGLFGSMSGSVVANVVGTGTFTIPMMIKRGFSRSSAGAIEAAASTGGQIMPPVMGAAAFLMSDLLGMNYLSICLAALVPALFYYGGLFLAVSLDAARSGIQPIPRAERQTIDRETAVKCLMFILPIITIITVLVMGRSPSIAGFYAVAVAVVAGLLINRDLRRRPLDLVRAVAVGGRSGATIIVAVAAIGVVLGVLNLTGVGLAFASNVAALGKDSLFLALLLTALTCLLLGMGMPTLPAYLIIVLVMGRSLRQLGIDPLAVHLFVFYFGVLSAITPPVAVAIFAAAPISGSHPIGTAVAALRLAFVGFIIPFVFVMEPSLLLVTESFAWPRFWIGVAALTTSLWALSTAAAGFDARRLGIGRRVLRIVLGLAPIVAFVSRFHGAEVTAICAVLVIADSVLVRRGGRDADARAGTRAQVES